MTCPRCGADASGNFCSTCGASLKQNPCPACGASPEPGARFCNNCGAALGAGRAPGMAVAASAGSAPGASGARGGARGGGASRARAGAAATADGSEPGQSQAGWWVAGVFFIGIILIVALPILRRENTPEPSAAPAAGAPGSGTPPDLSTMTPQEAADRLFNRVMTAAEGGNTAQVQQFMPMAIAAHEQARPLDLDRLFHLALLHQTAADYTSALAVANEILSENSDYLLGLSAAADAATALGDTASARQHYQTVFDGLRHRDGQEPGGVLGPRGHPERDAPGGARGDDVSLTVAGQGSQEALRISGVTEVCGDALSLEIRTNFSSPTHHKMAVGSRSGGCRFRE